VDRNRLRDELIGLGFARVNLSDAAEGLGVSRHTLKAVLQGKRAVPGWLMDRVRQRKEG